jgi:hypothetical protein
MAEAISSTARATAQRRRGAWTGRPALLAAIVLATTLAGGVTARAADESGCRDLPANATLDRSVPTNFGRIQEQLVIYRCKQYMADLASVLADAHTWAERLAPQFDKSAVVFDIDETVLSNWEALYHNKFAYVANGPCDLTVPAPCGQHAWELSAGPVALAPSLEFYRFVKTLKDKSGNPVEIFFVTGRFEDPYERIATEWNLHTQGYDTWSRLYLRPEFTRGDEVSTYKGYVRRDIEKTHRIIANLGDQYSDLIGEPGNDYAEKCFKLPNPFYFIPPGLPAAGLKCLQH